MSNRHMLIARRSFLAGLGPRRGRARARLLRQRHALAERALGPLAGPKPRRAIRPRRPRPGLNPNVFVHVAPDGAGDDRLPPLGDGAGHPQLAAGPDRRRARRRHGAGEDRPGRRRQGVRRPEHRRLDSIRGIYEDMRRVGRHRAHDAGRGRGEALEGAAGDLRGAATTSCPPPDASARSASASSRSRRASCRCPSPRTSAAPEGRAAHVGKPLPLLDGPAYVTGQRRVRRRRAAARHADRGDRAAAGRRRQGRALRREPRARGPRREARHRAAGAEAPVRVPALGRRRRRRRQHLGGDARPRGARHHVGPRRERELRLGAYRERCSRRCARPAPCVRNVGDVDGALAKAARRDRGRVPRAAPGARADGAAGRGRARRRRTAARSGRRRRTRRPRAEWRARARHPPEKVTCTSRSSAAASAASRSPTSSPRRRSSRRRPARRCACSGRARTTSATTTTTRSARSA